MANRTVLIKADKERNLKFGINALIDMEEIVGRPLEELQNGASIKDLRTMLYVGLKWEDKQLTQESTGDIMDAAVDNMGFEALSEALGKAMESAFGGAAMPSDK